MKYFTPFYPPWFFPDFLKMLCMHCCLMPPQRTLCRWELEEVVKMEDRLSIEMDMTEALVSFSFWFIGVGASCTFYFSVQYSFSLPWKGVPLLGTFSVISPIQPCWARTQKWPSIYVPYNRSFLVICSLFWSCGCTYGDHMTEFWQAVSPGSDFNINTKL